MEQEKNHPKQETDASILLRYIITCADDHNPVSPMLVLKEAVAQLERFRSNPDETKTAWDYIKESTKHLEAATRNQYWRQTPGYQVAAAMYILMRVDGFANIQEEVLANDICKVLSGRHNFIFNKEDVEMTIEAMRGAKEKTPPTIDPFVIVDELAKSPTITYSDWLGLLTMLNRMMFFMGRSVPYYMILHAFLNRVPDTMRRVDILGHLQDAAEKNWPEQEAKKFIEHASYLVHVYTRLHMILINNPIQHIWKNAPDMDELTMFVRDIRPNELVAIAQSIYDHREKLGERIGLVQHILTHSKYLGKLLTVDSMEFCKNLYLAHGFCLLMKAGKENFRELPSIDNLDCEFRNACFDVYIDLRLAQIKAKLKNNNRRLYPASDDEAYTVLCQQINAECANVVPNATLIWADERAQDSMVSVMQLLAQYTQDRRTELRMKAQAEKQPATNIFNVAGDYVNGDKNIGVNIEHVDSNATGAIINQSK